MITGHYFQNCSSMWVIPFYFFRNVLKKNCQISKENSTTYKCSEWNYKENYIPRLDKRSLDCFDCALRITAFLSPLFLSPNHPPRARPCALFGQSARHLRFVINWVCSIHSRMQRDRKTATVKKKATIPLSKVHKHTVQHALEHLCFSLLYFCAPLQLCKDYVYILCIFSL